MDENRGKTPFFQWYKLVYQDFYELISHFRFLAGKIHTYAIKKKYLLIELVLPFAMVVPIHNDVMTSNSQEKNILPLLFKDVSLVLQLAQRGTEFICTHFTK